MARLGVYALSLGTIDELIKANLHVDLPQSSSAECNSRGYTRSYVRALREDMSIRKGPDSEVCAITEASPSPSSPQAQVRRFRSGM